MKHSKKICAICIAAQLGAISINTQAYETFGDKARRYQAPHPGGDHRLDGVL